MVNRYKEHTQAVDRELKSVLKRRAKMKSFYKLPIECKMVGKISFEI